jgi:hypothetical protein
MYDDFRIGTPRPSGTSKSWFFGKRARRDSGGSWANLIALLDEFSDDTRGTNIAVPAGMNAIQIRRRMVPIGEINPLLSIVRGFIEAEIVDCPNIARLRRDLENARDDLEILFYW